MFAGQSSILGFIKAEIRGSAAAPRNQGKTFRMRNLLSRRAGTKKVAKRHGIHKGWNDPAPIFFHPYRSDGTARTGHGSQAQMGAGGGLFQPLDGACDYAQIFRVKNDLRILG